MIIKSTTVRDTSIYINHLIKVQIDSNTNTVFFELAADNVHTTKQSTI
jgi:hypothetical protein